MPFGPWDRNPRPCRACMAIYDDEKGRLKDQMIPCLQAHKAAAMGQTALLAIHVNNIGFPCPFACTLGDLVPYVRTYRGAATNQKAREIMDQISGYAAKLMKQTGIYAQPMRATTEKDFDMYDPRSYYTDPRAPQQKQGRFVVIKAEKGSALWNEFKPWYMINVSSSLNGWSMQDKFMRMLDYTLAQVPGEIKAQLTELKKPENALKFAGFLIFFMALNTNGAGRVLAMLLGMYLTAEMIATLAGLLLKAGQVFFEADTEAGLSEAGNWLAKFFAQIVIFLAMAAAAAAIGALVRGVLKNSRKQLEEGAGKNHPTAEQKPSSPQGQAPAAQANPQNATLWTKSIKPRQQKIADGLSGEPFFDLPANLHQMTPKNIRAWLNRQGFSMVKPAKRFQKSDGSWDWSSEVWYRSRPDMRAKGKVEAIRLDEHGHNVNPSYAGAKPHAHADLVDFAESQVYLNEYVPELPAPYRAGGVQVPKYQNPGDFGTANGKPTNPTYHGDTHNPIKPGRYTK